MTRVRFSVKAPGAKKVLLVGDFTNWEGEARPMRPHRRGSKTFTTRVELAPGSYEYKFIVDGGWREDPDAESRPNPFGTLNSYITVPR